MSMQKCPKCGELFSDTYRSCPFCEEEEALAEGRSVKRRGSGRRSAPQEPSPVGPVLIIILILLACAAVYFFFGDSIKEKMGFGGSSSSAGTSQVDPVTPQQPELPSSGSGATSEPDGSVDMPEVGGSSSGQAAGSEDEEPETSEGTPIVLSTEDFSFNAGETVKLTATGGSGKYTWSSDDDGVASVNDSGIVTAISSGNCTITVTDGTYTATCIARVRKTSGSTGTSTATNLSLSSTDFTTSVGEKVTLKVNGTSQSVAWASKNSNVATVSGGVVTAVGSGTTTVTATVGGKTLECIVRVK